MECIERLEYIVAMNLGYYSVDLKRSWPNTRQNAGPKYIGKAEILGFWNFGFGNHLANAWQMLGQFLGCLANARICMELHTRDLGMDSHSFLFFLNPLCKITY